MTSAAAQKPLLVVADDDPAARTRVEEELERRYGADYAVRGCATAEMRSVLERARERGTGLPSYLRPVRRERACSTAFVSSIRPLAGAC